MKSTGSTDYYINGKGEGCEIVSDMKFIMKFSVPSKGISSRCKILSLLIN